MRGMWLWVVDMYLSLEGAQPAALTMAQTAEGPD